MPKENRPGLGNGLVHREVGKEGPPPLKEEAKQRPKRATLWLREISHLE